MTRRILALIALLILLAPAVACQQDPTATTETPGDATAGPATLPPAAVATNTPVPPTPTPTPPLAATVNGALILLSDYEQELARYEAANAAAGGEPAADYREQVLNALIERELILQEAMVQGVTVAPEQVEERLTELRAEAIEFDAWLQTNGWTAETFREALAAEMVVGEMVARVTADVPTTAEHIRARYIQMDDAALAQSVLDRARAGDDFAFLAQQNSVDRVTGENGGDLGFFARGALLAPEVEEAAFALQPGEISDLITAAGEGGATIYYIIQVTEREPDRALTADARSALLQATFDVWLDGLWANATIERVAPSELNPDGTRIRRMKRIDLSVLSV